MEPKRTFDVPTVTTFRREELDLQVVFTGETSNPQA